MEKRGYINRNELEKSCLPWHSKWIVSFSFVICFWLKIVIWIVFLLTQLKYMHVFNSIFNEKIMVHTNLWNVLSNLVIQHWNMMIYNSSIHIYIYIYIRLRGNLQTIGWIITKLKSNEEDKMRVSQENMNLHLLGSYSQTLAAQLATSNKWCFITVLYWTNIIHIHISNWCDIVGLTINQETKIVWNIS